MKGDSTFPFSEPSGGHGYARQAIATGAWTQVEGDETTRTYTYASEETFSFTGGGAGYYVYGYFIMDSDLTPDVLLWAERFSEPENYANGTDIKVTAQLELSTRVD